jgi:hypothetical protein
MNLIPDVQVFLIERFAAFVWFCDTESKKPSSTPTYPGHAPPVDVGVQVHLEAAYAYHHFSPVAFLIAAFTCAGSIMGMSYSLMYAIASSHACRAARRSGAAAINLASASDGPSLNSATKHDLATNAAQVPSC